MPVLVLLGNCILHFDNLPHLYNQSYKVLRTNNIKLPMIQVVSGNAEKRLSHDSLRLLDLPVKCFPQA